MRTTRSQAIRLAIEALSHAEVPDEAAAVQAEILVEAELRGHPSHGLLRLPTIVYRIGNGLIDPKAQGTHEWVGDSFLKVDGHGGLGPAVAVHALGEITTRARTTGIAMASICSSSHLGMLAWYVERVASADQIGMVLTTSEALVHPWGGRQALVGSNPIAIGVPATPWPLILDMATSAVSMGKILDHANRGDVLQDGWAVDSDGDPTVDPNAAKLGAIAPFGGAKGYGLAIAFESIVATLSSSSLGTEVRGTLDTQHPSTKGDVIVVIQPPEKGRGRAVGNYFSEVRGSRPFDPRKPVSIPGDRSRQRRRSSLEHGFEVPDRIWQQLLSLRTRPVPSELRATPDDTAGFQR